MAKIKYYSLDNILKKNAHYNIIFGERSNGKTYATLMHGLRNFAKNGKQMAIVRRWNEDFKQKRAATMFDALVANHEIEKLTDGDYNNIVYKSMRWYLCHTAEGEDTIINETPFAYGFSIASMEHDKSTSYPNVTTVIFDEFLTRGYYLPDEFVLFENLLSTIIRQRDDVTIFMLGNTVNKYCPYFTEMGLINIKKMGKGDIDVYQYGESALRVAVEFADMPSKDKPSDVYFAFNNPRLSMITGKGQVWEIDIYPHLPQKYTARDIQYTYFIRFDDELLQCEIIRYDNAMITYIHRKTTEIKHPDKDVVFTTEYDMRPNYIRGLKPSGNIVASKIYAMFANDKVFYQDNEVGEIVRNFLLWSKKN